jgi:2-succinyl-6-hydroxy-2,4-cyclohexadiene-1-carboxylate synthase
MIHCLHGFMGLPSDWNPFVEAWSDLDQNLVKVELYSSLDKSKENLLSDWARKFNQKVRELPTSTPRILMGYSMGGRLALHALVDDPDLWQGAIIVSAHPGLSEADEKVREARRQNDSMWAERFLVDNWVTLQNDWNRQDALSNSRIFPLRSEAQFDREKLARALVDWSLSKQSDLRIRLKDLKIPILWCWGEQDEKFKKLALEMPSILKLGQFWEGKLSGHRLPWEDSKGFSEAVHRFLIGLNRSESFER